MSEEMEKYNDRTWLIRELVINDKNSKELEEQTGIDRRVFGIWADEKEIVRNTQVIVEGRKLCSRCGDWKPLDEFNSGSSTNTGYESACKICINSYRRARQEQKTRYQRKFKNEHPEYSIHESIGGGIWASIKEDKGGRSWEEILPYNFEELKEHLRKQFKPGMSLDNHGEWHIDHIKPRSSFDVDSIDDPELQECWALDNLQPLWAEENLRKSDKDPDECEFAR